MTRPPRGTVPCHDGDDRRLFLMACDMGRDGEPIAVTMADALSRALDALEEKRERDHTGRSGRP